MGKQIGNRMTGLLWIPLSMGAMALLWYLVSAAGCRATLSGSHKQHFIIANFSRKKAQSHLNDTVMPLFLHSFSSVPGY